MAEAVQGVAVHLPVLIQITLSLCVCLRGWNIFCQERVNVPAGYCLHTFPVFMVACKSDCQWNQKISSSKKKVAWNEQPSSEVYLENELLIEDGIEGLPVDLGLKLLLLVRQQVDLHVWVGRATHVHSRQLCGLDDPNHELKEGSPRGQRKVRDGMANFFSTHPNEHDFHLHPTNILAEAYLVKEMSRNRRFLIVFLKSRAINLS